MQPESFVVDHMDSPIGMIRMVCDVQGRLCQCEFESSEKLGSNYRAGKAPQVVRDGLAAYFVGALDALISIVVRMEGTAFQQRVWRALREIPVGSTTSYGALAAKLGDSKAARAVGLANNRNPVGIVVPCHRVIGADGSLTGYAGGLSRKRWLLTHERALLA